MFNVVSSTLCYETLLEIIFSHLTALLSDLQEL